MKNKNKIIEIADHYGAYSQMRQCMEECAELAIALSKYMRCMDGQQYDPYNYIIKVREDAVNSEMADVKIMLKQLEYFFENKDAVKEYMDEKLDRQLERIKNEGRDS